MVRALIHCSAWFGTGITTSGFCIEKLSLTALNLAVDHDQIRLLDERLVVEKLAVKSNPIRPFPALRRRPPHDVDVEGPFSTIEHNRRAKARAREHHQHAFCRRPRRQKRKALADDRSDAPDIAAALGKRRVEARADGEVRQQTVKQVIGLLDAPELAPIEAGHRRTVGTTPEPHPRC